MVCERKDTPRCNKASCQIAAMYAHYRHTTYTSFRLPELPRFLSRKLESETPLLADVHLELCESSPRFGPLESGKHVLDDLSCWVSPASPVSCTPLDTATTGAGGGFAAITAAVSAASRSATMISCRLGGSRYGMWLDATVSIKGTRWSPCRLIQVLGVGVPLPR